MQKTVFNDLKNIFKVTKTIELELKPIDKNNDIMEDKEIHLCEGETCMIPSRTLHAVGGGKAFKILQITVNE